MNESGHIANVAQCWIFPLARLLLHSHGQYGGGERSKRNICIRAKILSDRTIYNSRSIPFSTGKLVLCDLGEARAGTQKHSGDIMPDIYRAPEVILGMGWDCKVDIWAIGVMVSCKSMNQQLVVPIVFFLISAMFELVK